MVRRIDVIVPSSRVAEVEEVLEQCDGVHHRFVVRGEDDSVMISLRVVEKRTSAIVDALGHAGCGVTYGVIDIQTLSMSKPRVSSRKPGEAKRARSYRTDDRISVEEVYQFVDEQAHLTFDYLALTTAAALIAGAGLLADSAVMVVASMLVSPLMGPIMSMTFGTAIGDSHMVWKGLRNEIVGVMITFGVGLLMGLCVVGFDVDDWVTEEMLSRGRRSAIISGIVVAIPSGAGVALACTNGGVSALVGVAIAASLLPPISNSAITLVFGLGHKATDSDEDFAERMLNTAGTSAALFFLNWVLIWFVALIFFRIKNVRTITGYELYQMQDSTSQRGSVSKLERGDGSAGGERTANPGGAGGADEDEDELRGGAHLGLGEKDSGGGAAEARAGVELR